MPNTIYIPNPLWPMQPMPNPTTCHSHLCSPIMITKPSMANITHAQCYSCSTPPMPNATHAIHAQFHLHTYAQHAQCHTCPYYLCPTQLTPHRPFPTLPLRMPLMPNTVNVKLSFVVYCLVIHTSHIPCSVFCRSHGIRIKRASWLMAQMMEEWEFTIFSTISKPQ